MSVFALKDLDYALYVCFGDGFGKKAIPLADRQLVYMAGYDILENGLEVARYEDGVRVVGNFTDAPLSYEGKTIPAWDFIVMP